MTPPRLVLVVDGRQGYDDRSAEFWRAAQAAGWDVCVLLMSPGTRVVEHAVGERLRLIRIGVDGAALGPHAVRLRALDDKIAVLRARRIALARSASRHTVRRAALVAAIRRARAERCELQGLASELGDPVAAATAELARLSARLAEPLSDLGASVVVAAGPHALAGSIGAPRGRLAYDRRRTLTATEPALAAAVGVLEESAGSRLAAVVSTGLDPVDGPFPPSVPRLTVPEPADGGCDWREMLALLAGLVPGLPPAPVAGTTAQQTGPPVRLGVAPANFAGQGWAWGRSVERFLDDVTAEVVGLTSPLDFPADVQVRPEQAEDLSWQLEQARRVLGGWSHVLAESVRPVLGQLNGSVISGDMAALHRAAVKVAVVCHGTDIRGPGRHLAMYPHSPFGSAWDALPAIRQRAERNRMILYGLDVPVFVSTPDLLDDVPHARWLPVAVAAADFAPAPPIFEREVPVVLHLPSEPRFKGTEVIDRVAGALADDGLIEYRSLREVSSATVAERIREADVVIDHIVMGNYGVLACQAMAAGRLTVGHVHQRVRRRVGIPVPMLEANPQTLDSVLRSALADRQAARQLAAEGPDFVRELHDGRASAQALASFLGR